MENWEIQVFLLDLSDDLKISTANIELLVHSGPCVSLECLWPPTERINVSSHLIQKEKHMFGMPSPCNVAGCPRLRLS